MSDKPTLQQAMTEIENAMERWHHMRDNGVNMINNKGEAELLLEEHPEQIKCPQCGTIQTAMVLHTIPWYRYVHECIKCNYVIMESEWEVANG